MNAKKNRLKCCLRAGFFRLMATFSFLLLAFTATGQVLELQSRVTVTGTHVLLKEIVRQNVTFPEEWGSREITDAPLPQEGRKLTLSDVAVALQKYDDMSNVVLRGSPVIELTSASRPVQVDRIQDAINEYVRVHPEWHGRRFEVCSDRLGSIHVPNAPMEIDVMRLQEESGAQAVFAEISLAGGRSPIRISLEELRPFWAFVRPHSRGDLVAAESLVERWVPEREAARYYSVDQVVVGMELRRNVQEGQLLAQGMLSEPVYIRRGEVVRVVYEQGGLSVTLRARALADGRRDESILCVNESSGQRMYVRMIRPREALLDEGETERATS